MPVRQAIPQRGVARLASDARRQRRGLERGGALQHHELPVPDNDPEFFAIPNNDGPLQTLPIEVSFGNVETIEFWPDGSAHVQSGTTNPWPVIGTAGLSLTMYDVKYQSTMVKSITVNGLGKITLQ